MAVLARRLAGLGASEWRKAWNRNANRQGLRGEQRIRCRVRNRTDVLDGLPGARASLEREPLGRANGQREVHTSPLLIRAVEAVVLRALDLIVRLSDFVRRDVVQRADLISPAPGQSRVGGSRQVERAPVAGRIEGEVAA